jgi:hypothetical protein
MEQRRVTMRAWILMVALLLTPGLAIAAGPVNPSTVTWTAPTTNADNTPLADLGEYRIRVAGPAAVAPSYNPTVYPVKGTKVSPVPAPAANTSVVFGTAGSNNLAGDLGLTVDGQYWLFVTAVDVVDNESGVQPTPFPFARNRQAPSVPQGVRIDP